MIKKIDSLKQIISNNISILDKGEINYQLASAYLAIRNYDSVGYHAYQALAIYNNHKQGVIEEHFIYTYFNLGMYYTMINIPRLGLESYNKALSLINSSNNKLALTKATSRVYSGFAIIYRQQNNNLQAIEICQRFLKQITNQKNLRISPSIYYHLSNCYLDLANFDSAAFYSHLQSS